MDLYIVYRHRNFCYLWRVRNEQCPYKTCQDMCEEFFRGTTNKKQVAFVEYVYCATVVSFIANRTFVGVFGSNTLVFYKCTVD